MEKKIVLIDGHSILNRAFYGVPNLTNSEGMHTNAIYGFLNIMLKILEEETPEYLTVAFDVSHKTFRHELYPQYKGTRKEMPDELKEQVPIIKEVLIAMGVRIIEKAGYEADDILGTIAKIGEREGYMVSLVSGDKDLLQLASEQVKIRIPKTKHTGTEIEDYNTKDVLEKYGIIPEQIVDLKGLMGDASDNIPGVPSIGEKTAIKIIKEFHSLENAYKHIEEITPKRAKDNLKEHYDLAQLSKQLATIKLDCDLDYTIEETKIENLFTEKAFSYFKRLEFKSLLAKFEGENTAYNKLEKEFTWIDKLDKANTLFQIIKEKQPPVIGLHCITEEKKLLGISITYSITDIYYIAVNECLTTTHLIEQINQLLQYTSTISVLDLKQQLPYLHASEHSNLFDTKIAAYLLNPLKDTYDYDDLARDYAGLIVSSKQNLLGKVSLKKAIKEKREEYKKFACYTSFIAYNIKESLENKLKQVNMWNLFKEIEMPLIYTLYDMEVRGIKVKREILEQYSKQLGDRIIQLEAEIYTIIGEQFNINSPKQLGVILFEKLRLPFAKKTKTGYSTSADILEKLRCEHEVIGLILEYRQLTKLKSTYADGLALYINPEDNRIHGTFNQTITATGRISSTEPNLQNIPIRMELGRLIRKVFVPEQGYIFLDADYSQIELRVLAHMSEDQTLIESYRMKQDIHKITASQVFYIPFEEVTSEQRRNAKAVNFGIVYGISSFGLGQDLNITKQEAENYMKQYFATYPNVKLYLDNLVKEGKETGYVTTLFQRRRPIPELKSSNFMQRAFGERIAMNSPIQGTAADIIKIAMIKVNIRLKEKKMKSRLVLQIHDELLVETHNEEVEEVKKILREEMMGAAQLMIPMEVDIKSGCNWYEAH